MAQQRDQELLPCPPSHRFARTRHALHPRAWLPHAASRLTTPLAHNEPGGSVKACVFKRVCLHDHPPRGVCGRKHPLKTNCELPSHSRVQWVQRAEIFLAWGSRVTLAQLLSTASKHNMLGTGRHAYCDDKMFNNAWTSLGHEARWRLERRLQCTPPCARRSEVARAPRKSSRDATHRARTLHHGLTGKLWASRELAGCVVNACRKAYAGAQRVVLGRGQGCHPTFPTDPK